MVLVTGSVPTQSVPICAPDPPLNASVIVTHLLTSVGLPEVPSSNWNALAPVAWPDGVENALWVHSAVAVFVPLFDVGPLDGYEQLQERCTAPLFGTGTLAPLWTTHVPPLST